MARFLWTKKQHTGPKPRMGQGVAFDSARGRVVLFGGDSLRPQPFSDTWEWDGEYWTQMSDIGPSARSFHAMAYDSTRKCTVLFGGRNQGGPFQDTWEWNGEDWTQVSGEGPAARVGHSLVFDANRLRTVLFGGDVPGVRLLRDTWEWNGDAWTQAEDTGPPARRLAAAAFDATRKRLVLFGGDPGAAGMGDTWEWDGAMWTQVADFGPEPRTGAAMAFKQDRIALFGGIASSSPPNPVVFGSTWEWNGTHWTQRQDIGPEARWGHGMAYDSVRNHIVLYGGLPVVLDVGGPDPVDRLFGDTWEHSERESAQVQPPQNPVANRFESFVIAPGSIRRGERATATLILTAIPAQNETVILTSEVPLVFDPPVTSAMIDGVSQFVVPFPAGTKQVQFRFRDRSDAAYPPFPFMFGVTVKLGASSLTTVISMTA